MLTKKIKIALFADDVGRKGKGTAVFIEHLIEEYIFRYKNQLELVLVCNEGRKNHLQKFGENIIWVKNLHIPRFSGFLSYFLFFISVKERFDIVHFPRPTLHPFFWLLKVFGKTKKIIVTFHGAPEDDNIPIYRTPASYLNRWFIAFLGKYFIDASVVDSHSAIKQVANYYALDIKKISFIYLGVDDIFLSKRGEENIKVMEIFRNKHNFQAPYILSVSRLDPHKNVHRLIEAFIHLKKTINLEHRLVLLSGKHDPKYSKRVFQLVKNSSYASHVQFLDFVELEEMPFLYKEADVFVYVSLSEGFGLPLLEAMGSGTPVVTSNISCMPEIAMQAAITVDPWDYISIAEGIKKILENTALQDSLKEKGFKRAAQFSWQLTAEKYFVLYENCLYH